MDVYLIQQMAERKAWIEDRPQDADSIARLMAQPGS